MTWPQLVGTWNVEYGHPGLDHARRIMAQAKLTRRDWLALQELRDYASQLAELAELAGWELVLSDDRQLGLLVRPGQGVGRSWSIVAGTWWRRTNGKRTPLPQALVVRVADQLVVVVHAPVGAWTTVRGKRGRHWVGAVRRRLAYRRFAVRIVKVFRRHPHVPVSAWGDWNATPDTRGKWSPDWIRRRVGGVFIRSGDNTGHGEVDFGLVRQLHAGRGVKASRVPPSDHKLVTATVRPTL